MPSLPLELIRQIVEDLVDFGNWPLSYSHLSTVSLSCRLLRFEAQRLLFRSPGELFTHNAKRKQTTLFLDTIISSPERLALLVEYFIIIFDDWFEPDSDETAALIQQLTNALQAMHNLTLLEVYQWKGTIPPLPNILRNTHFKLTHFVWSGYARTEFDDMNFLANFLRHQDKIEHLHMAGFINEDTLKKIASDILPCLRSLSAPYSFTEILLPEKEHVTSLRWVGFGDDFNTPLPRPGTAFPCQLETISKELGRIRYLSYDSAKSCFPVGPGLQQISSLLTSLICLDTRRGDIKPIKHLDALSQLPRLRVLVLNTGEYPGGPVPDFDYMVEVATSCRHLEHIDIEDDRGKVLRFDYDDSTKKFDLGEMYEDDWYTWEYDYDNFDD